MECMALFRFSHAEVSFEGGGEQFHVMLSEKRTDLSNFAFFVSNFSNLLPPPALKFNRRPLLLAYFQRQTGSFRSVEFSIRRLRN